MSGEPCRGGGQASGGGGDDHAGGLAGQGRADAADTGAQLDRVEGVAPAEQVPAERCGRVEQAG